MNTLGALAGGCPWLRGARPGGPQGQHQDTQKPEEDGAPCSGHPHGLGSCSPSLGTGRLREGRSLQGQHSPRQQTAGFPALPQKALAHTCRSPLPSVPGHVAPASQAGTISTCLGKRPKDPCRLGQSRRSLSSVVMVTPAPGPRCPLPGRAAEPTREPKPPQPQGPPP